MGGLQGAVVGNIGLAEAELVPWALLETGR